MKLDELIFDMLRGNEDGQRILLSALVDYWGAFGDASQLEGLDTILTEGDSETVDLVIRKCIMGPTEPGAIWDTIAENYDELAGLAALKMSSALGARPISDPVNEIIANGIRDLLQLSKGGGLEIESNILEKLREEIKILQNRVESQTGKDLEDLGDILDSILQLLDTIEERSEPMSP